MNAAWHAARLADALAAGRPAECLDALGEAAAARDVRGGVDLGEALARHAVLPAAYRAAFSVSDLGAARQLVAAARRLRRREDAVRRAGHAALAMLTGVLAALGVGGALAVPALRGWLTAQGLEPSATWVQLSEVFATLGSPLGAAVAGGLLVTLWFAVLPLWRRSPTGRRAHLAAALSGLEALIAAKVDVVVALGAVAEGCSSGLAAQLRTAADRIEGGQAPGVALSRSLPAGLDGLMGADGGRALPGLLAASAGLLEAEAEAEELLAGRWIRLGYGLVAGGLAAAFAVLIATAWVEILHWFA